MPDLPVLPDKRLGSLGHVCINDPTAFAVLHFASRSNNLDGVR